MARDAAAGATRPRWEPWLRPALFAASAVLYVLTASPGAQWLDSGELAATAASLGVPHPPGHPLFVISGHALSLVPLGPLAFRVALASALAAALAVVLLFELALTATRDGAGLRGPGAVVGALAAAVTFALSGALWIQAVRAEVYALHLATALGVTLLAVRWSLELVARPRAAAWLAAFLVGLGLANHHLLLVFLLPALLPLLVADAPARARLWRALPGMVAFGLAGLALYALLPLRAAAEPAFNYGSPDSPSRLLAVITASVFQRSVGEASTPLADNLASALSMFLDALGAVVLVLAPFGLALLARRRRRLALALGLIVVLNLLTKVLMDLDPTNPDAAGYFLTSMAVTAALTAPALAWALATDRIAWRALGGLVAAVVVLMAGARAVVTWPRVDLASQTTTAAVDSLALGRVLPGAVLLTSHYSLHFNRGYHQVVEGMRPDVVHLHQGLDAYVEGGRPHARTLGRRHPALAPALDAFVRTGTWPRDAMLRLAVTRPLYLEPSLDPPLDPARLRYAGLYLRVTPAPTRPEATLKAQAHDQGALAHATHAALKRDPDGRKTLLLKWLELATVRLRQGSGAGAMMALDLADTLSPSNPYSARLRPLAKGVFEAERAGDPRRLRAAREQARRAHFGALFGQ